ncbi:hypothetical protein MauCBS54593_003425 [Microsporum audouinii]
MADILFQPRSPYPTPSHPDGGICDTELSCRKVSIHHPAYNDDSYTLIAFIGLDHPAGGIHHETARIACAILAGNRWDGFLTETRTGERIREGSNSILQKSKYYFRLPNISPDEKFPITPSFSHYRFPQSLPSSWRDQSLPNLPENRLPRQSSLVPAPIARDISCRVTNHTEGTEHAHLIPRSEQQWYIQNRMSRYANIRPDAEFIDDTSNAILLRSDIHSLFDQKRFVIVPKADNFVIHILASGTSLELINCYHNVTLQPLTGVAIECLFARFAWSIFAYSTPSLLDGLKRTLSLYVDGEAKVVEYTREQCRQLVAGAKSRSQSPRKRQRDIVQPGPEDDGEFRGRKRRRSFELLSSPDLQGNLSTDSEQPESETDFEVLNTKQVGASDTHDYHKQIHGYAETQMHLAF